MNGREPDLLGRVLGPPVPEIGCDECFEQLDRYVDIEVAGGDPDAAVPGMRAHLEAALHAPRSTRVWWLLRLRSQS